MSRKKNRDYWKALSNSIESAWGVKPTTVHGQSNLATYYYIEYLLRILKGIFKIKCPQTWDKDYILNALIFRGCIAITDTDAGVLPLTCSLTGVNVFELPTTAIISNPILGNFTRTIDKDCVIIVPNGMVRRSPLYTYILYYATKLADIDASIETNLFNSRTSEIYRADNKQEAASIKAMVDGIGEGNPAVFVQNATFDNAQKVFIKPVKTFFIADDLQATKRVILEEFLTGIGINNANTDKRERLNEAEVNSNNEELLVNTAIWKRNLKEACKKAEKMFDIEFKIKMPYRKIVLNSGKMSTDKTQERRLEDGGKNDNP